MAKKRDKTHKTNPFKSKKAYRQHCVAQTLAGLCNTADGVWVSAGSSGATSDSIRNVLAGCHGTVGRRVPKKKAEAA